MQLQGLSLSHYHRVHVLFEYSYIPMLILRFQDVKYLISRSLNKLGMCTVSFKMKLSPHVRVCTAADSHKPGLCG